MKRKCWSRRADSNRRPADYESAAQTGVLPQGISDQTGGELGRERSGSPLAQARRGATALTLEPAALGIAGQGDDATQVRGAERERLAGELLHDHPDDALVENQQRRVDVGGQ